MSIRYDRYSPSSTEFLRAAVNLRRQKTSQPDDYLDRAEAEITRIHTAFSAKKPLQGIGYLAIASEETVAGYVYAHKAKGALMPKLRWWSLPIHGSNYVDLGGLNVHNDFMGEDVSLNLGQRMLSNFEPSLPLPDATGMMRPLLAGAFDNPENQGYLDVASSNWATVGEALHAVQNALTLSTQQRESLA